MQYSYYRKVSWFNFWFLLFNKNIIIIIIKSIITNYYAMFGKKPKKYRRILANLVLPYKQLFIVVTIVITHVKNV